MLRAIAFVCQWECFSRNWFFNGDFSWALVSVLPLYVNSLKWFFLLTQGEKNSVIVCQHLFSFSHLVMFYLHIEHFFYVYWIQIFVVPWMAILFVIPLPFKANLLKLKPCVFSDFDGRGTAFGALSRNVLPLNAQHDKTWSRQATEADCHFIRIRLFLSGQYVSTCWVYFLHF